ncbi:hydrogenase expression protein HypE [Microlunatus endophyticus]|uniref:Hydrogenase expression protein HypE n=1 Tax=Microlunatus endophyticus TaxID=1716077 RepID=A0A917SGW9_9ACTN|nr:NADH-quinone oxidoreductase subunit C [Microlunatus endophyticus]GGL79414.1 hydrogenase expression protein HypE [Microlunatus endophyticus]
MPDTRAVASVDLDSWRDSIVKRASAAGGRLAVLMATAQPDSVVVTAIVADEQESLAQISTTLVGDQIEVPSLTDDLPAALWYEREIHDLFGIVPIGHPRLDPLILPVEDAAIRPRPGLVGRVSDVRSRPVERTDAQVTGEGVFVYPHGPVRSAALESIEYDIETPGEDIPYPQIRVYYKHRGLEKRFEQLTVDDGALLAERVEGIASVSHATAFATAVEAVHLTVIPQVASSVRVFYAELERMANHLDVVTRLCDAAALAVATARFSWHKERVLRLMSDCSGSRFGRGVVVPGGVTALPAVGADRLRSAVGRLAADIRSDADALMLTPSFLDRLRGTGILNPELADRHGAIGPIGRASGSVHDVRHVDDSPYRDVGLLEVPSSDDGDALARLTIRWSEINTSVGYLLEAIHDLDRSNPDGPLTVPITRDLTGSGIGRVEAPQGELIYLLQLDGGRIRRCKPRTASFHNLPLFHAVFTTDILTDFPFIEASFGLSSAGVAM